MSFFILLAILPGCEKFLEAKPNARIAEPKTLEDVQWLLDYYVGMNINTPNLGMQSDDDFYLTDVYLSSLPAEYQQAYKWEQDVEGKADWAAGYKTVLHANLSLEILDKMVVNTSTAKQIKLLRGAALFYRSLSFFHMAQHFALHYEAAGAAQTPGIPVRLASDINTPNIRNNLSDTYQEIINSLQQSLLLLPEAATPVSRPSKAGAYALLSNVYLNMRQYSKAGLYADSALQLHSILIDYNTVSVSAAIPFAQFNKEVIFSSAMLGHRRFNLTNLKVDSVLYGSYAINDLRRTLYYKASGSAGQFGFKGNYEGNTYGQLFNGFTTAEMMLIKAEAAARNNDKVSALQILNALLRTRWKTGIYTDYTAVDAAEALTIVLKERRKELAGRGKRWYDLRRLNKETGRQTTIRRKVAGTIIELLPGSKRYTFYIPYAVIAENGMEQNER